jgi:hypothetical protein
MERTRSPLVILQSTTAPAQVRAIQVHKVTIKVHKLTRKKTRKPVDPLTRQPVGPLTTQQVGPARQRAMLTAVTRELGPASIA